MKRIIFTIVATFITTGALAQDILPLRHGIYVTDGVSCGTPPYSDLMGYYGDYIAPGHNTCTFGEVTRHGNSYETTMTCLEVQSDNVSQIDHRFTILDREHFQVAVMGNLHFTVPIKPDVMRWCGEDVHALGY